MGSAGCSNTNLRRTFRSDYSQSPCGFSKPTLDCGDRRLPVATAPSKGIFETETDNLLCPVAASDSPHHRAEDRTFPSDAALTRFDQRDSLHGPDGFARNAADGVYTPGRHGADSHRPQDWEKDWEQRVHSGWHASGERSSGAHYDMQAVSSTSPRVGRDDVLMRSRPLTFSGSTSFNLSDAPPVCPPNPAWDDVPLPTGRPTEIIDSNEPEVREPLNRISTYIEEVVREVLKHVPPDVLSLSPRDARSESAFTAGLPLRARRPQLLAEFLVGLGYAISPATSPRGPIRVLLSPAKFASEADFYDFTFHLLEYVAMIEAREELEDLYRAERPLVLRARL